MLLMTSHKTIKQHQLQAELKKFHKKFYESEVLKLSN